MTASPRFFTDPLAGSSYVLGQKLPAAHMNAYIGGLRAMDLSLERNMARNWPESLSSTSAQDVALCWCPTVDMWIVGYQSSTDPLVVRGTRLAGMAAASTQPPAEEGLYIRDMASDQYGTVVMCGDPGSSSNHKYRYSDDGGDTWSSSHSTVTSTTEVSAICYAPGVSLFVSGAEGGIIETSPIGTTWTAQTNANANAISAIAASDSKIVAVSSATTNKCVVSSNGTSWVESTLPVSTPWYGITYLENQGYWMAIGVSSGTTYIAISADAVSWSSVSHSLPASLNPRHLVSTGNFSLFANASASGKIYVSEDLGTTWDVALNGEGAASFGTPSVLAVSTRDGVVSQIMCSYQNSGTRNRFASNIV